MAMNPLPSISAIGNLLDYDPKTGVFTWKPREGTEGHVVSWNKRCAGKEAGTIRKDGYHALTIDNKRYLTHRIVWLLHYGRDPTEVDHINGKPSDNRIVNLREVTRTENNMNAALQSNNKSGFHGVRRNKQNGRWIVEIKHENRRIYLGHFDTLSEAAAARKGAERVLRFHRNHGRKKS